MSDKKDLLFEIGTEEIPARFLPPAVKQIEELAAKLLAAASLNYDALKACATPRRLVLQVKGLDTAQADSLTEQKGPALKAAYDAEGNPSRALEGFCRSQGVTPDRLLQKEVGGNLYLFAVKEQKGGAAEAVLPGLLSDLTSKIYFPKPMRWGYNDMRFARPIRWLVALFGDDVLQMELAGVKAGRISRGHRELGSQQITIADPASYEEALAANFVIVDVQKRKSLAWQSAQTAALSVGGCLKEDEELLDEVAYLVEYPTALVGSFAPSHLSMPRELIITPMREHQRYFPVYDGKGDLLAHFVTVRNGGEQALDVVAAGNEKVLEARLADAAFFWDEDLKLDLAAAAASLSAVVFHEKIGSLSSHNRRTAAMALDIAQDLGFDDEKTADTARAAAICKADLVSKVVYEFPELQGIMGEYYARHKGEPAQVAQAIREHYLPRFAGDDLPQTAPGYVLALAERIESICTFFAVGLRPTGSQDPYALRRAASGVVQIVLDRRLDLSVSSLLGRAFERIAADVDLSAASRDEVIAAAGSFISQRLAVALEEEGLRYDVIDAVMACGADNLYRSSCRAKALAAFKGDSGFAALMAGFKRAANLSKKSADEACVTVDPALFEDAAEGQLYLALNAAAKQMGTYLAAYDYAAALQYLASLTPLIDGFFNAVMVMVEVKELRANRLALLAQVTSLTAGVYDLTRIAE